MAEKLGADWEMFKQPCPECGKDVFVTSPRRSAFCSKQCEANYNYRTKKFGGSNWEDIPSRDKVKKW